MEIKYTIEILTKDIQDIEKLVGNLRNSNEASSIELDLAMAKIRNVYEILTMIKADRYHELFSDAKGTQASSTDQVTASIEEGQDQPAPPEPEAPQTPEPPEPPKAAEAEPPKAAGAESSRAAEVEPAQAAGTQPAQVTEPEPVPDAGADADSESVPEEGVQPKPEPAAQAEKKEHSILAEKFTAESSINENLAGKMGHDADAKLVGKPIDNISRNIGINDRFLIIRELFDGDADRFTNLVNALDNAENLPAANGILKDQFAGTMDHEGVQILTGLLKRRFIR
jgi:hypothetical protein